MPCPYDKFAARNEPAALVPEPVEGLAAGYHVEPAASGRRATEH
jgi:hypothetical protein